MALGPLTNIAIALAIDPNLSANLAEIFLMGGNTEGIGNVTTRDQSLTKHGTRKKHNHFYPSLDFILFHVFVSSPKCGV